LEQSLASIDQIDLDKELADFARQYAKEKSLETEKERDDGDSTTNSDQKSISSQTRKTAAGETPVSATDSTLNDFKVDEEGYRVPQMDHSKWLNEFTTATQPDTSAEEGEVVGSIS
jgi:hypothetical protein